MSVESECIDKGLILTNTEAVTALTFAYNYTAQDEPPFKR